MEETSNHYILATHSHALMTPRGNCNVVYLWQQDGVTRSRTVQSTEHSLEILDDLGIDASDLLQARSVIWVEGPSDRIYIYRWLALVAPDLREGGERPSEGYENTAAWHRLFFIACTGESNSAALSGAAGCVQRCAGL
jgi:hypothetical protein